MTVLIVEDDSNIRTVMTEILEDEGYIVASVTNGLEALAYLRQLGTLPRLILLDLGMPVMTGWEFCEEQQHDITLAAIPVVIMSALPNLPLKAAALQVMDCLGKPIDIDVLLDLVARYLPLSDG